MGRLYLMGTEFQLEKMNKFQRGMQVGSQQYECT